MIYLSIVIPIRNEEKFIGETLSALAAQDYPRERFELLVVDGQSTDSTCAVVKEFMAANSEINVRLLDNPGVLSSCARNIGIKAAQGELIGVIDGHVYIPNDKLFFHMEQALKENNALCLSRPAPLDVPSIKKGPPFWIAVARKSWLGHSSKSYIYIDYTGFVDPMSAGFAYHRSVFARVGYFDESFDAAEDVEFHYRLKTAQIESFISPELLIYSYPRETLPALFKQQVRYGVGRARLIQKHPEAFTKETLIPVGVLFGSFLAVPASVLYAKMTVLSSLAIGIMGLYWLILLLTGFKESISRRTFLPGILVFLSIWSTHLGLGWGFIKTIFLPPKREQ